jgi:hypothetical protein
MLRQIGHLRNAHSFESQEHAAYYRRFFIIVENGAIGDKTANIATGCRISNDAYKRLRHAMLFFSDKGTHYN